MAEKTQSYSSILSFKKSKFTYFDLIKFSQETGANLNRLPFSLRILLEGCLRNAERQGFTNNHALSVINWKANPETDRPAVPFLPARILMQDFTGVPVLNDLAALRVAITRDGKDPRLVNPRVPSNLVIDHSLQVSAYGCPEAQSINESLEFNQNFERYQFLKWSQSAFDNLQVLPPGLGICHQVNLEHLGQVVFVETKSDGNEYIYPDSVLGTDSHTTMINGLGVMGWGVGGIEALAAMLEYPSEFPLPDVVGVHLTGSLSEKATPTDLTLTLTAELRRLGVVGKFVEVFGESVSRLPVETRAMISNMSPESGATMTYFPVDSKTINYLLRTGRKKEHIDLVEAYFRKQKLFNNGKVGQVEYSFVYDFDLGTVEPVIAGPKRPQDTFTLINAKKKFTEALITEKGLQGFGLAKENAGNLCEIDLDGKKFIISHGSVLIAAITSCTNTSDPSVIITAALMAKNAAAKGLHCKPWVKTSFAPGSRVVEMYLKDAELLTGLNDLGFGIVGYGCTTCIGNSGPIDPALSKAIQENNLITAAVLSGNRNFEGRIHPAIQANYLASPPLVVAYALSGTVDIDLENEALGIDRDGKPVFLKDIFPPPDEVARIAERFITNEMYEKNYSGIYKSNERWNEMHCSGEILFEYDEMSSLIKEPEFLFYGFNKEALSEIKDAYALVFVSDSVTTDHISPAGRIASGNSAGLYLREHGVEPQEFISFGARRGNHDLMVRGTFSNPRLRNKLAAGKDGGFTTHFPSGEVVTVFEAAQRYTTTGTPLVILAGKAYGIGSRRDWAAKGTYLLGIKAVIAESFERIHRTNLVCMGILPLQFKDGENADNLGLKGSERFTITGISKINTLKPDLTVSVHHNDGRETSFTASARIDTPLELSYFKAGGLMRKLRENF